MPTTKPVTEKSLSRKAITDEIGRRRANRQRRSAGQKVTRPKSWVLGGLTGPQLAELTTGGTTTVEFSKQTVKLTVA